MAAFIKLTLFVSVLGAILFGLVEPGRTTTHKPRNNAQLYKEFKNLEDKLLKADLVTGTKGCQYLQGLHRVNGTRFFIYDSLNRKDIETNFTVGRQFCENLNQRGGHWRLAQINNLRTFRMISLQIEETSFNYSHVDGTGYKDSWYWIDAYFNYTSQVYQYSNGSVFKFNTVLLSRHNRPLGIGAHEIHDKHFDYNVARKKNYQQCLTLALPWPNESEKKDYPGLQFGHQASFDDRACESVQKFKPICENLDENCRWTEDLDNPNYFPIDELVKDENGYIQREYTDDGMWVYANRRFLVNLKPRNKNQAKTYCKKRKTKLYVPHKDDHCLIPYIKLWNIRLTHLHLWTSIKAHYTGNISTSTMYYENGSRFDLHKVGKLPAENLTLGGDLDSRNLKWEKQEIQNPTLPIEFTNLCVTANWIYEYPNETSWRKNAEWNFLTFAYANCNLYMGTIYEHKCNWMKGWTANYELAIVHTAVIEFGYKGSGIYRSTYKQQYGQQICQTPDKVKQGVDYEISFDTLEYYNVTVEELDTKVQFYYDYLETYWVVDHKLPEEDWFKYATEDEEECWVSRASRTKFTKGDEIAFKRDLDQVNCLEWHFYLCGPEPFEAWVHEEL